MATSLQRRLERRDTSSAWAGINPVLGQGEWGVDTGAGRVKIGDGLTAWNDLPWAFMTPTEVYAITEAIRSEFAGQMAASTHIAKATRAALVTAVADGATSPLPDGAIIYAAGLAYERKAGATIIADMPGLIPAGNWRADHFGFGVGLSASENVARLPTAVAVAAQSGMTLTIGSYDAPINATMRLTSPNAKLIIEGDGPRFIFAGQNHGALSIGREATNFHIYGNLRGLYAANRTPTSGSYAGLLPIQQNSLLWIEASGFKHVGRIETQGLFTSVCVRGPVKLRTGEYLAFSAYAGVNDSLLDFRENMLDVHLGDITGTLQDFVLSGTEQTTRLSVGRVEQIEQTYIQEIDSHCVYLTGKGDPTYGGRGYGLRIAEVAGTDCPFSMPVKLRDYEDWVIGPVNAYQCAGAVLLGERTSNGQIGPVSSIEQVDRRLSAPSAPTSTVVDVSGGTNNRVLSGRWVAADGQRVMGVKVRGNGSCSIADVDLHQKADVNVLDYAVRLEENGTLRLRGLDVRRSLPSGGVVAPTIRALISVVDNSRLVIDGITQSGAAFNGGVVVQAGTATVVGTMNHDEIDGYSAGTAITAADITKVKLTDIASA